jgi:hypothetical protein
MKIFEFFLKYIRKMVGAGTGAGIFDKLEPEPHKKSTGFATLDRYYSRNSG